MWVTWGAEVLPSPEVAFSPLRLRFIFHPPLYLYFLGALFALFGSLTAVKYRAGLVGALLVPALGPAGAMAPSEPRPGSWPPRSPPSTRSSSGSPRTSGPRRLFPTLFWWALRAPGRRRRATARPPRPRVAGLLVGPRHPHARDGPLLRSRSPRSGCLATARGRAARAAVVPRGARAHRGCPGRYRNWLVFGAFVPVSTAGALNLWQGNTRLSRQEVYEQYWAVRGRIAKYEHARRRASRPSASGSRCWIFEKLRDEMPNFWEADSQALVHIGAGPTARCGRALALAAIAVVLAPYLAGARAVRGRARDAARSVACPPAPRVPRLLHAPPRRDPRLCALSPARAARRSSSWPRRPGRAGARPRGAIARAAPPGRGRGGPRARRCRVAPSLSAGCRSPGRRPGSRARGVDAPGGHGRPATTPHAEGREPWRAIPLAAAPGVIVRVPFWIEALRTPVDGDTAIVGLMARHPGEGRPSGDSPTARPSTPGWPRPSWRPGAAPPRRCACPSSCSASPSFPSPTAGARASPGGGAARRRARWPARRPTSCSWPRFPPPLYATTLVLCGLLLLPRRLPARRLAATGGPRPARPLAAARALLAGLALWTHLMSASVVAAAGAPARGAIARPPAVAPLGPRAARSRPAARWWVARAR